MIFKMAVAFFFFFLSSFIKKKGEREVETHAEKQTVRRGGGGESSRCHLTQNYSRCVLPAWLVAAATGQLCYRRCDLSWECKWDKKKKS